MRIAADVLAFSVRLATGVTVPVAPPRLRRPIIFFVNHTSNLDALLVWSVLSKRERGRVRPVAARDYWGGGGIRSYIALKVFNALLIERRSTRAKHDPLVEIDAAIEAGHSIIIFPEGTRALDDEIAAFKGGIYHLASRHPAAVLVPVYLRNLNRVLPKGEFLPVPVLCSVIFGEPMRLKHDETKQQFLARSRSRLQALRERGLHV